MTQKTQRPDEAAVSAAFDAWHAVCHRGGLSTLDGMRQVVAAVTPVIAAAVLRSAAEQLAEGGDRRAAQRLVRMADEQEQRDA